VARVSGDKCEKASAATGAGVGHEIARRLGSPPKEGEDARAGGTHNRVVGDLLARSWSPGSRAGRRALASAPVVLRSDRLVWVCGHARGDGPRLRRFGGWSRLTAPSLCPPPLNQQRAGAAPAAAYKGPRRRRRSPPPAHLPHTSTPDDALAADARLAAERLRL
jgi:hypothetical protein